MRLVKLITIVILAFSQSSFSQTPFQVLFKADSIKYAKKEFDFNKGMPKDETELSVYFLEVITDSIGAGSFDEILECAFRGKKEVIHEFKN